MRIKMAATHLKMSIRTLFAKASTNLTQLPVMDNMICELLRSIVDHKNGSDRVLKVLIL